MRFTSPTKVRHRAQPDKGGAWLGEISHPSLVVVALLFFVVGGVYIYLVNERAVYGYDMRTIEKELVALKKQNAELRLQEAEGRSLVRVEDGSTNLRMERAIPTTELVIETPGSVAYR